MDTVRETVLYVLDSLSGVFSMTLVIHSGLVLLAGLLLVLLSRRTSAAYRHLMVVTAQIVALSMPLVWLTVPDLCMLPQFGVFDDIGSRPAPARNDGIARHHDDVPSDVPREMPTADNPVQGSPSWSSMPRAGGPQHEEPASHEDADSFPRIAATTAGPVASRSPAASAGQHRVHSLRASNVLAAIWLIGSIALAVRIVICGVRLRGLYRRSSLSVPDDLKQLFDRLRREAAPAREWRLVVTEEHAMPMVWGVLRPVILIPENVVHGPPGQLRSVLEHELAHVYRHDPLMRLIGQICVTLYWFNPLSWMAFKRASLLAEQASDNRALQRGILPSEYAEHLMSFVRTTTTARRNVATAMAKPSWVRQRIAAILDEGVNRSAPTWRAVAAAAVIGVFLAWPLAPANTAPREHLRAEPIRRADTADVARSNNNEATSPKPEVILGEAPSDPPASSPERPEKTMDRMVLRAVVAATGKPLAKVEYRFHGRIGGKRFDRTGRTDPAGEATLEWPAGATIQNLWMTAGKPEFVPVHYTWRSERRAIELPEKLELRFEPGVLVGGIVQDESGRPIAGAEVVLSMPITWPVVDNFVFYAAELTTDAEGRWQWPSSPIDPGSVGLRATHSDYLKGGGRVAKGLENVTILKQGLQVTGRILNEKGKPVQGAIAQLGFDRFGTGEPSAKTDKNGRYVIKNCKPGKSAVTASAHGLCPQVKDVYVGEQTDPVDFQLEPGHVLRGRVVDVNGHPLAGVFVGPDTWRGYRTLEHDMRTDVTGRFKWQGAPPDAVEYSILKKGYMAHRDYVLKGSGEEVVITMFPELVISGRVSDASTGEPIPKFRIRHGMELTGRDEIYWTGDEGVQYTGGSYSFTFDEPHPGSYLRVIAPGYLPADSRKFESTEGAQTFDFQLHQGRGPSGIALLPNGEPAVDAEVGLATRSNRATLETGYFDRRQNRAEVVKTDGEGRFAFPPLPLSDEPYLLIALHEEGYADVTRDDFEKSGRITLEPWGRLEGRVMLGAQADADREVSFVPFRPNRTVAFVFDYGYSTKTDRDGKFAFERVMPGSGSVYRSIVTEFLESWQHTPGWQVPVEITAHKTTSVTIGGTGQPVVGRLVLDREADVEIDWRLNEPVTVERWDPVTNKAAKPRFVCVANLETSGRFRIPDVPAGDYQLALPVNNPPVPNACGAGEPIGRARFEFTVPEIPGGRSDDPLDLDEVTATLFDTLDPGELAPDFLAKGLSGDDFRLSDMAGKLVLLDFWATWCGPCLAEMPALKEIHDKFGNDERFVLVGLSCDQEPEPARQYVKKSGLGWRQAHVGGTRFGIPAKYTVRSLPATFLITPSGRVLAKNLRGQDLKDAIAAALNDKELFDVTGQPRPARFPVVRFDVPADEEPLQEEPAVVLLDNCDPTYEKDQQHVDGLRLYSATGKKLWAHREFNNSQSVSGKHSVALDRRNGRIYVSENTANRITAFDVQGYKLWQISPIETGALCVDPRTGHLWSSGGPLLNRGQTVVFDRNGREVSGFAHRAIDMVYDHHSDAFWLVGYRLTKLNRQGDVLFDKQVDGWMCGSVSVNPDDGSVWIGERDHPDVARSRNRLWHLDAQGKVLREISLKEFAPFVVESDPAANCVWVGNGWQGLLRVRPDQPPAEPLPVKPYNISISPATGQMWVVTENDLLRLDSDGQILGRYGLGKPSSQAWLVAF